VQLVSLQLKNFRCFEEVIFNFKSPIILIEGDNGSGKTSILEALHYLGYLKSFRTHIAKELIKIEKSSFFIKATFKDDLQTTEIQAGLAGKKRLVKINQKSILSFKELLNSYRVITLTEEDLDLVKLGPENRRNFLDQYILLTNASFLQTCKKYKQILDNRNKILQNQVFDQEVYLIWTKQLWEQSQIIRDLRRTILQNIEIELNDLLNIYIDKNCLVNLKYEDKEGSWSSFDNFLNNKNNLLASEKYLGKSMFGSHLDDFHIYFKNKKSRAFASRGQQKLLVLLVKIAQINILKKEGYQNIIFLLDDFITDLDQKNISILSTALLSLKNQLIFTCPISNGYLKELLVSKNAQIIQIDINDPK